MVGRQDWLCPCAQPESRRGRAGGATHLVVQDGHTLRVVDPRGPGPVLRALPVGMSCTRCQPPRGRSLPSLRTLPGSPVPPGRGPYFSASLGQGTYRASKSSLGSHGVETAPKPAHAQQRTGTDKPIVGATCDRFKRSLSFGSALNPNCEPRVVGEGSLLSYRCNHRRQ